MSATVFISYARKDADLGAASLDAALKPRYAVWRDVRGIDPAQDFTAEIEKAIQAAAHVVVCVTPDVLRDDSFVRREIAYANYLKKPILVARFANVPPPIHIFTNTWIDFFKGWDAAFETLCHWLDGAAVASSRSGDAPTPPPDAYKAYLEAMYADLVESIRASVFSNDMLTLRTVATSGDVGGKTRQLNPKYVPYTLREAPAPAPPSEPFPSLRAAYDHAHCQGRVLLLGEPGAGKTTTLLAFARDAAAARLSDPAQPLPLFARISGWNAHDATPLHDWLAGMHKLDAAALRGLIEGGQALLLLDGLDELGGSRPVDPNDPSKGEYDPRERFLKVLPTTSKVILSSRVEEYRQIGAQAALSCAVRLERLDDGQMAAYLADVAGLWAVVSADAELKEALRTPLLLALVRVAYEDAPEDVRALRGKSAGDLNDRIWNAFIDKRWMHEQARQPDVPLPYTAQELKRRLGMAAMWSMRVWGGGYTHIVAEVVDGLDAKHVIGLAERLDMLKFAGNDPVSRWSKLRIASYRFLHLRLHDALAYLAAVRSLRDTNENVRSSAALALGQLGDARAVKPLIAALGDPQISVRGGAVDSLGKLGDARAVEPLIAALRDPNEYVRSSAARALAQLGDPAVEPLIVALHDPDRYLRRLAAWALGALGNVCAVEPLITALHDQDWNVRLRAAEALEQLGAPAVPRLAEALQDPDKSVRHSTANALSRFPNHPAAQAALADYRAGKIKPREE